MATTQTGSLTSIGTVRLSEAIGGSGASCKLVYDEDQKIVWLDYIHRYLDWHEMLAFAEGLNDDGALTYELDPGRSVEWTGDWRLSQVDESMAKTPTGEADLVSFGSSGPDENGYHDYAHGYNMQNSEAGRLFYGILGNKALVGADGTMPQPDLGFQNAGPFEQLGPVGFWLGTAATAAPGQAWYFYFDGGGQGFMYYAYKLYGIVVRPAIVS